MELSPLAPQRRHGTLAASACPRHSRAAARTQAPDFGGFWDVTHAPHIERQFPRCTTLRRHIAGTAVKITLLRARLDGAVPRFHTAHTAVFEPSNATGRRTTLVGGLYLSLIHI